MMPAIKARDEIHQINLMAVAFGSLDKDVAAEFTGQLQRLASVTGVPQRHAVRPTSAAELAMLAGGTTQIVVEE